GAGSEPGTDLDRICPRSGKRAVPPGVGEAGMKNTNLPLLKFSCDNRECMFECFVNQNNNLLTHYNPNMSALLDWPCPECKTGFLRFNAMNTKFDFTLQKTEKEEAERTQPS